MLSRGTVCQRELCISQHGSQDIVEVVGNTPYQGPQRLHFLRLAQLGFQLETFGNVTDYDNEPLNTPVNGKSRSGDLDVDLLSIFADHLFAAGRVLYRPLASVHGGAAGCRA